MVRQMFGSEGSRPKWLGAQWVSALLVLTWICAPLAADAEPAVSTPNGKLTAFGGGTGNGLDDEGLGGLAGSYTIPIGTAFGAQFDGSWARISDENFANTGLHLFWRDPSRGLLGLYGGYAHLTEDGGVDVGRTGVEAQYFAGSLTFDAAAGVRFGDIDTEGYGRARLDYYVHEDFKLSGGYLYEGESFATAGAEFQLNPNSDVGMTLFADARVHDEDSYQALAGIKLYFGERMTLMNRHRKQDPDGYTDADLLATQQAAAQNRSRSGGGAGGGSGAQCPFEPYADACSLAIQCIEYGGQLHGPDFPEAEQIACGCTSVSSSDCF